MESPRFRAAIVDGKTNSNGGLNKPELLRIIQERYPNLAVNSGMSRAHLVQIVRNNHQQPPPEVQHWMDDRQLVELHRNNVNELSKHDIEDMQRARGLHKRWGYRVSNGQSEHSLFESKSSRQLQFLTDIVFRNLEQLNQDRSYIFPGDSIKQLNVAIQFVARHQSDDDVRLLREFWQDSQNQRQLYLLANTDLEGRSAVMGIIVSAARVMVLIILDAATREEMGKILRTAQDNYNLWKKQEVDDRWLSWD